jgi:hypothetical protein
VEPLSRWKTHEREPYHFGFLNFPLIDSLPFFTSKYDQDISINYLDTYSTTVNWTGLFSKNNVMVIAGVYDARSDIKYSYGNDTPYYAHYLDAAAGARPGETAYNTVTANYTHTVLVEVATKRKCPYCPIMEDAFYNLSQTGQYPFYFIDMVYKRNRYAAELLFDRQEGYSQSVVPEAYFDGGYQQLVGGDSDINNYTSRILSCGARDVHQLNLSLSVTWKGLFRLGITITIKNNEEVHYPLKPVEPYSPSDEFLKGEPYTFSSHTTDPDGDDLYYNFEYATYWGDRTESGWLGPYHSGDEINTTHTFTTRDGYYIRVRAKDINNEEGPRSEYKVISVQ